MSWTRGLGPWYRANGRHSLPWRATTDPWAVLVSEIMLQQTQVSRVLPRWQAFMERWPEPAALALTPLADLLRFWQGLGYPRRARDLHACAGAITAKGWPHDEHGLLALPGVGRYTARALLCFAFRQPSLPPCDVNVGRVAARAALGSAAPPTAGATIIAALAQGRPKRMNQRDYVFALFDVGSQFCRAAPRCRACPLRRGCAYARAAGQPHRARVPGRSKGQPPYAGSFRAVRGAVLREMLSNPPPDVEQLRQRLVNLDSRMVDSAYASLLRDRLLEPSPAFVMTT